MTINKQILHLALPAIVTNITVPLLGLVDTAIAGHLGRTACIGAVSVGATLFNMIYWNFGFLRMGTSGQTSQAYGRRDFTAMSGVLARSLFFSALFSVCIFLLQFPVVMLAFRFMGTTAEVEMYARQYFYICLLGAPAVLGMYSLKGWFIGMQNTRFPMLIAITINVVNIVASLFFVFVLHLQVRGVALGTLVSQYVGLAMALLLWWHSYRRLWRYLRFSDCLKSAELRKFFTLNGGIFLRTFCLNAVMAFFTFAGAHQGEVLLAVNVLLLQLFNLFSYFTDGFAYAGEALVGKYVGMRDLRSQVRSIRLIFVWGTGLVACFTLLYAVAARPFVGLLTSDCAVQSAVGGYYGWVLLVPLTGAAAFLWDGIMVGATSVRPMVYATFCASSLFFVLFFSLYPHLGNHALWLAFVSYLAMRGLVQTLWARRHWQLSSPVMNC